MKSTFKVLIVLLFCFILGISTMFAQTNYSISFDGSNDYVNMGNVLNITGSVTIEAWINPSAKSTINTILAKKAAGGATAGYALFINSFGTSDGKIHFETQNAEIVTTSAVSVGSWQHIAVVVSGGTGTIYVNGVAQSTSVNTVSLATASDNLSIGAFASGASFQYFGYIDEVRIWNTAVSGTNVAAWYDKKVTASHPNYANLQSYWKFDEGSGTTTNDSKGTNTGTLTNGPTYSSSVPAIIGYGVCSPSPSSLAFGNINVGSSKQDSITITNTGSAPVTISTVTKGTAQYSVTPSSGTIAVNGTQKFYVTFSPTSTGAKADTITFTHDGTVSPTKVPLSGTGVTPSFSVSPTSLSFGNINVGSSKQDSVTVTNSGTASLIISSVTKGTSQYSVTPTTATISASGTQKFYITFTPSSNGSKLDTLSFTHNATGSPGKVPLSGTGVSPSFSVSPALISFGNINVGSSQQDSVTVTNSGTASLIISSVSKGTSQYSVTPTTATISASGTQKFYITFTPTSNGSKLDTVSFIHNASGSPGKVPISGTGVSPSFSVSPLSVSFGDVNVGSSKQDSVTVTNSGTASLVINSVSMGTLHYTVTPSSATIAAGNSQKLYITFSPGSSGTLPDTITFDHNASNSPGKVPVTGTGGNSSFLINPNALSFGGVTVGASKADSLMITNTGTLSLIINTITLGSPNYSIMPNSATIAANDSQKFYVAFSPLTGGSKLDTIIFNHNASGSPTKVPVSGTGLSPAFTMSPSLLSFNNVYVGSSKDDSITITNTGNSPLIISSATELTTQYSLTPTSATIAASGTQKFYITFSPQSLGNKLDTILFVHNAPGSPGLLPLSGTGVTPSFSVSAILKNFGNVAPGVPAQDSVVVSNTGTGDLLVSSVNSNSSKFTVLPISGTIPGGGQLKFYFKYIPTTATNDSAVISFAHNGAGSPSTVTLKGTGYAGVFKSSSAAMNLGSVPPNQTKKDSVIITNTGTKALAISSVVSTSSEFAVSPVSGTINPNATLKIYLNFTPVSIGSKTGSINITHDAAGSPFSLSLSGQGSAPSFACSKTSLTFASIAASSTKRDSIIITNSGNQILKMTSITLNTNQFSVSPSSDSVLPNSTRKIYVTFQPTSSGSKVDTLNIVHNASGSQYKLPLSGSGGTPAISLSPSTIAFGNVSTSKTVTRTITVSNTGTAPLVISNITSSNSRFVISPTTATISNTAGSNTKQFTISFATSDTLATTGTLTFTHNAGTASTVSLSGKGIISPGYALQFNGTGSYVTIPNHTALQLTNNYTLEAWVKPLQTPGTPTLGGIISKNQTSSSNGYFFNFYSSFSFSNYATISSKCNTTGFFFSGNPWFHIAVTRNGSSQLFYLNGVLQYTGTCDSILSVSTDSLKIGSNLNGQYFKGIIDEVRIWKTARSQSDIRSTMKTTLTGNEANLVLYMSFDEGTGSTVGDLSSNKLTGYIKNGATFVNSFTSPVMEQAQLVLSGSTDLGNAQGNTTTGIVTFSDTGGVPLTLNFTSNSNPKFSISPSSTTIQAGQSQAFTVTYTPTTEGFDTAHFTTVHNATGMPSPANLDITGSNILTSTNCNNRTSMYMDTNYIYKYGADSGIIRKTFSVTMWVKSIGTRSTNGILSSCVNDLGGPFLYRQHELMISPTNDIILSFYEPSGRVYGSLQSNISQGIWHHIAYSIDYTNQVGRLYIDGNQTGTTALNSIIINPLSKTPIITAGKGAIADIDEYAQWDTILTQAAIQKIMYAPTLTGFPKNIMYLANNGTDEINYYKAGSYPPLHLGAPLGKPYFWANWSNGDPITSLDWGQWAVNAYSVGTYYLKNAGNATLNITGFSVTNPLNFKVTVTANSVGAGADIVLNIAFTPTEGKVYSDTLKVYSNSAESPITLFLKGTGISNTTLSVPKSFSLGTYKSSTPGTIKIPIKNTGTSTAFLTSANETYYGAPPIVCSLPASGQLASGATDSITINYNLSSPLNPAFNKIALLTQNAGYYEIPLSGTAYTDGRISLNRSSINFGTIPILTAPKDSIIITNTGTTPVNINAIRSNLSIVQWDQPGEIPTGQSRVCYVTVKPLVAQSLNDKVYIQYLKGDGTGAASWVWDSSITISGVITPPTRLINPGSALTTSAKLNKAISPSLTNGFSFEFWIQPNHSEQPRVIFSDSTLKITLIPLFVTASNLNTSQFSGYELRYDVGPAWWEEGFENINTSISNGYALAPTTYNGPVGRIRDNQWHHVMIMFTPGNSLYTFIDGNLYSSVLALYLPSNFSIGKPGMTLSAPGKMDEVKIWNKEMWWNNLWRFQTTANDSIALLTAYWNFDKTGTSNEVTDLTGNTNPLVLASTPGLAGSTMPTSDSLAKSSFKYRTTTIKKNVFGADQYQLIPMTRPRGITTPLLITIQDTSTFILAGRYSMYQPPFLPYNQFSTDFQSNVWLQYRTNPKPIGTKTTKLYMRDYNTNQLLDSTTIVFVGSKQAISSTFSLSAYTCNATYGTQTKQLVLGTYSDKISASRAAGYIAGSYVVNGPSNIVTYSNGSINTFASTYSYNVVRDTTVTVRIDTCSGSSTPTVSSTLPAPANVIIGGPTESVISERLKAGTGPLSFDSLRPGTYYWKWSGVKESTYTYSGYTKKYTNVTPVNTPLSYFTVAETTSSLPVQIFKVKISTVNNVATFREMASRRARFQSVDTAMWTNPAIWGSKLPYDTMDVEVSYPGYYDQFAIKMDLGMLNSYCASNPCDGNVSVLKSLTIADSAKLIITGSGTFTISEDLAINGNLTIDADSTAMIVINNLSIYGSLTIPEGKNPVIIINGNVESKGLFAPGSSTVIINGANQNFITRDQSFISGDTLNATIPFATLILNSDSTIITDKVSISKQLKINGKAIIQNYPDQAFDKDDTLFVTSTAEDAITGIGSIESGILSRVIDTNTIGPYRFHSPATVVQLHSSVNLPSRIIVEKDNVLKGENRNYIQYGGTVNQDEKSILKDSININGLWSFGSNRFDEENNIAMQSYRISTIGGSVTANGNLSFKYDAAYLNDIDENSLQLLKNSTSLQISNFRDVDGDVSSDSDRVEHVWRILLYKDSVAIDNLITDTTGTSITLYDLPAGSYIIVPEEQPYWKTTQRKVNELFMLDSTTQISVYLSEGKAQSISFTRLNFVTLTASAPEHITLSPGTYNEVAVGGSESFTFLPDNGYKITSVFIDGVDYGPITSYRFDAVTKNHVINILAEIDDQVKFRTFTASPELAKTAVALKYKKGQLAAAPNLSTAVQNVFAKIGKTGATFVGLAQTQKDSAKKYAWIAYKSSTEFGKLFTLTHTGTSYPIDTLRGKKPKFLKGIIKADRKTYNNIAFEEAALLKLNILSSQYGITPPNFGALQLDTNVTLLGRNLQGATLSEISSYIDSIMTYWKKYNLTDTNAYKDVDLFMRNVIKSINDGYYMPISANNAVVDSTAIVKDKKPYSVTLKGVANANNVRFIKYVAGVAVTKLNPTVGYEELPEAFTLYQNYPNPFNPGTTIDFDLPNSAVVTLNIYNILGQVVSSLYQNEYFEAGKQSVEFDASEFASGVYFYRIEITNVSSEGSINTSMDVKKMMLIK